MKRRKLLEKISRGALQNVSFQDLLNLAVGFGFVEKQMQGSHHILAHPDIPELLNLQEVDGQAKPYQIRQFLKLVEAYNLRLEDKL